MTATRAAATAVALATLALGLAACGDDDDASGDGPPDLGPTSEATSSSDPTELTTPPGPKAIPTSYPDVGLEYDGLPDLDGKYRDALEVFVDFDRGRLELLRDAKMNSLLSKNAAEPVVATYQSTATYLQDHNAHYRGTSVASFNSVKTDGDLLGLDLCLDGTDLRYVEAGAASAPDGPSRVPFRVIVTQTGGSWSVTEAATQEGSC